MLSLTDLIIALCLAGIGGLFWQLRKISEVAEFFAKRHCRQRQLQFLTVARIRSRLGFIPGQGFGWHCQYQCEFSTDGINQLFATLHFAGNRLTKTEFPVYPEPEWEQAPESRGKLGMGCCGGGSKNSCSSDSSGCR